MPFRKNETPSQSLDQKLLFGLSLFLLAFIPLFPKIPLFDALPGYIVRVRIEDFLVLLAGLLWLKGVFSKKLGWNISYFWFVGLYAIVGLSSIALGIFLLQTIPPGILHIGKSFLHFFRYLEYFSLFFFLYSSISKRWQIYAAVTVLVLTLVGVVGYGIGQKYFGFPLYSTMNREYSKGERLYLQPGARLQSTFAGHYDLAAYLVIILPFIFSLSLKKTSKKLDWRQGLWTGGLALVHLLGLWTLLASKSKAALIAYALGMAVVVGLYFFRLKSWRKRFKWFGVTVVGSFIAVGLFLVFIPKETRTGFLSIVNKFQQSRNLAGSEQNVGDRPVDLVGDGFGYELVASTSATGETIYHRLKVKSNWSENALKYGLSMGIRLDTLWPQAIKGFANNPLFGSGYGTLAMLDSARFTEADSTDNNFLRTLGETGLLGFVVFYGIVFLLVKDASQSVKSKNRLLSALSIGFVGASSGLLFDALYIDVFAASKVAFSYWALSGLVSKSRIVLSEKVGGKEPAFNTLEHYKKVKNHLINHWPAYLILLIAFFSFHHQPFTQGNLTRNIESRPEALKHLTSARCFLATGEFNVCRNSGLELQPLLSIYSGLLVPFLMIFKKPNVAVYFLNITIMTFVILGGYFVMTRRKIAQGTKFFGLLLIAVIGFLLRVTQFPLTSGQLFVLVIAGPALALGLITFLKDRNRVVARPTSLVLLVLLMVISWQNGLLINTQARFRNNSNNTAYQSVISANKHFAGKQDARLISLLNPYYYDLFSSSQYQLLPLSASQTYMDEPQLVWGDNDYTSLYDLYDQILKSQKPLYITDYGVSLSDDVKASFAVIKENFDLEYETLDCLERCSIYKVKPEVEKISAAPITISRRPLNLESLTKPYTFSVVSNRFDTRLQSTVSAYLTKSLVEKLLISRQAPSPQSAFLAITGDITASSDPSEANYFSRNLLSRVQYPTIYNLGNQDIISVKIFDHQPQTFFTDEDFFILLEPSEKSQLTHQQILKFYNDLLILEKLKSIRNVFIIAHNLNWQDKQDPKNAIHLIERKLKDFPNLNKHIITANQTVIAKRNDADLKNIQSWFDSYHDLETKTWYWASLMAGHELDGYLELEIKDDGEIEGIFIKSPVKVP